MVQLPVVRSKIQSRSAGGTEIMCMFLHLAARNMFQLDGKHS